jgi:hypothetical protein
MGVIKKCTQCFSRKMKDTDHEGDLIVDERYILEYVLMKHNMSI